MTILKQALAAMSGKTVNTFLDGTYITIKDVLAADIELKAFLIYLGAPYASVMNGRLNGGIWKTKIFDEYGEVSEEKIKAAISLQLNHAKPRFSLKNLNDEERKSLQMGCAPRTVAWAQGERKIGDILQPIAGREAGWTLLGVKSEAELVKLVHDCHGPTRAKETRKNNLFPELVTLQLLARRHRIEAARAATGKSKKKAMGLKRNGTARAVKISSKK